MFVSDSGLGAMEVKTHRVLPTGKIGVQNGGDPYTGS